MFLPVTDWELVDPSVLFFHEKSVRSLCWRIKKIRVMKERQ